MKSWHVKPKTTQPRDSWTGKKQGSQQNKCSNMNEKWKGMFYLIKSLSLRMCECVLWGAFQPTTYACTTPVSFRKHKSEPNVSPFTLHTGAHKHVTKQNGSVPGKLSRTGGTLKVCMSSPSINLIAAASPCLRLFSKRYECIIVYNNGTSREVWQSGALYDVGRNIFSLHLPFKEVPVPTRW